MNSAASLQPSSPAEKQIPYQFPLALPARPTSEIIEDRLAVHVADFNDSVDPLERSELMQQIRQLRGLLGTGKARP